MSHSSLLPASVLIAMLAAAPLAAQDTRPPGAEGDGMEEGMDLLGRGMDLFLRGLIDEIEPQLRELAPELRGLAREMGPMLSQLVELIGNIDAYHPPEKLPNGDIIIRRKDPSERAPAPLDPPVEGEVDI